MVHFHGGTRANSGRRPAPGAAPDRSCAPASPTRCGRPSAAAGWRPAPGCPPSRSLAADLGIARNTVADAYAELVAEGWLTARQGSGTRVAERAAPRRPAPPRPGAPDRRRARVRPAARHPRPRAPSRAPQWLAAARRALTAAPSDAFGYGDPRGRVELRTALAELPGPRPRGARRARAHRGLLRLRARADAARAGLRARGARTVAVESYGLDVHRELLAAAGLRDAAAALRRVRGPHRRAGGRTRRGAAHPGAPVPDGRARCTATGGRRSSTGHGAPAGWSWRTTTTASSATTASRSGALQGLDPDRVVYLGSASKCCRPALRLGWMALPAAPGRGGDARPRAGGTPAAVPRPARRWPSSSRPARYDRHVRAMRQRYRRRRDQLVAALAAQRPDDPRHRHRGRPARRPAAAAGHARRPVLRAAACQGLALDALTPRYRHADAVTAPLDALVVGYGTPPDHAWSGALDALCAALPFGENGSGIPFPG